MSARTAFKTTRRTCWSPRARAPRWRYVGVLLVLGLALVVAACGSSTGTQPGTQPTAIPTPSVTPTPSVVWRLLTSPNPTRPPDSKLTATAAPSPTDAWAVGGSYTESGGAQSLIERWDGSAWHIVPNPGTDVLNAVVAISTADAWAVGGSFNYGVGYHPDRPLIMHWNGVQWSNISSPDTHANAVELSGVAAHAANDVWAVGAIDVGSAHTTQPLVERWDGAVWHIVPTPLPTSSTDSALKTIGMIPGSEELWAVGYVQPRTSPSYAQPLIERWDGDAWRIVAAPTLPQGAFGATLSGVVARTETDAWAVGDYTASNHTIRTLVLHWDGVAWKTVSSPDTWGTLSGVAAAGSRDVRAVGHSVSGEGDHQAALILQWDGTTWHRIVPPTPSGATYTNLSGVTSDEAGTFWAVGSARNAAGNSQTLIERCP